ncbi:MAG: ABC transporter permease [Candidatus Paceibacteria bacterium]
MINYALFSLYRAFGRTVLTMVGLMFAVILVATMWFGVSGLQSLLKEQLVNRIFEPNQVQVISGVTTESDENNTNKEGEQPDVISPQIVEELERRSNIRSATGILQAPSLTVKREGLTSLDVQLVRAADLYNGHPAVSSVDTYQDEKLGEQEIWISSGMADMYEVSRQELLGKEVQIEFQRPGNQNSLRRTVTIGGIGDLNSSFIHVVFSEDYILELSKELGIISDTESYLSDRGYDQIFVKTADGAAEEVKEYINSSYNVEEVIAPQQILDSIQTATSVLRYVLLGLASVSIIIGLLSVSNTIITMVYQQTKEIGVMKSLGASNIQIMGMFMVQSIFVALFASVIGVGLTILAIWGIADPIIVNILSDVGLSVDSFFVIDMRGVLWILGGSVVCGAIVGIFPALRAATLDPKESVSQR